MGDNSLRCLTCQGKLGPAVVELRCEVCSILFWIQNLLVSDRFPAIGGRFVVPELRAAYYKALEVADSYQRHKQGGEPPRSEDKGLTEEEPRVAETTPKSRPAVKPEKSPKSPTPEKKEEKIETDKASYVKEEREEEALEKKGRDIEKKSRGEEPSSSVRGRSPRRSPIRRSRSPRSLNGGDLRS